MADIVAMKFGGTSLRDDEARAAAAEHVRQSVAAGKRVAIVVSAMGRKGEPYATDTLISLLASAGEPVAARELDLAMSAGEILSASYLAHLLNLRGIPARAFTGPQAGILTDDVPGQAEILSVRPDRILTCLEEGAVAVVAGFQGETAAREVRTLGRGGSDTRAVARGAALGAEVVEIYTDVDGIAAADPRRVPGVPFLAEIGAAELLTMAEEGSRVLHPRAVRASLATATPLCVRNTFSTLPGTLVHHEPAAGPARAVALAHRDRQLLLRVAEGGDPRLLVPELLDIGGGRFLLLDDVYRAERLARLRDAHEVEEPQRGWATASLILSGAGELTLADAALPGDAGDAEALPDGVSCRRYLVRESQLDTLLRALYEAHLA